MATKFKDKNKGWVVKYKDADGKWKNKYCGKNANAIDAEAIRNGGLTW